MKKRTARQPHDFYETPPHYLAALDRALFGKARIRGYVYEPCVGNRAIADWLPTDATNIFTNDIDLKHPARWHYDACSVRAWKHAPREFDWVITNPPFSDIERILELARRHSHNVISLARLSFLEPTASRRLLFKFAQPRMVVVLPRYQFSKPSKDTMTCCWVGWGPNVPASWSIETQEPPK